MTNVFVKSVANTADVQLLSHIQLCATLWTAALQALVSFTTSRNLLRLMHIKSKMLSNLLILCCSLPLLPSFFPSIRVFSNESALYISQPKYWSFSFTISTSNEHSGLISFRIDWFDFLAVQGTLKCLLQHLSSKTSSLWDSVFFMVPLLHPYTIPGKTIALTIQTFVSQVPPLLLNMLPRFFIAFLPRSKCLLISWLKPLSAVIFVGQENKICHCFHCFSIYLS